MKEEYHCPKCGYLIYKKNTEKKPGPKPNPGRVAKTIKIFKKHPDWPLRKIAEKVKDISHVTVRRILQEHGLWNRAGKNHIEKERQV